MTARKPAKTAKSVGQRALLVMAKQPVAGRAKTRLVPPLTGESAAALYHCFLRDVLATVRAAARLASFTPVVAYTPAAACDFFRSLAPDFKLIPQQSGHRAGAADSSHRCPASSQLGDRLQNVLSTALRQGHRQVVAINSDSPTLPAEFLRAAFQCLEDPQVDAVFGPCADGGYYLIGVKKAPGRLVTAVEMSTPTVLQDTLAIAAEEELRVELLPEWYDVDSANDLERLRIELDAHPQRASASNRFFNETWPSMSSFRP